MNEELTKQLEELFNKSRPATHQDLKENVDFFLGLLKELRVRLQNEINESGKSKDERIILLEKTIAKSEANVIKLLNNFQNKNKSDVESYFNLLKKEINRVEKSIPELPKKDDSSKLENKIEETISRLESLEEDDECEKLEENFNDTINELRDEMYSKLESFKKDLSSRNVTGRPIFGRTNIKVLDNGTVVSDVVTELNFTNATSISVSGGTSRRVDIETGGSGSSTGAATPIAPTSGAINSSNTAFVFATEPKVIVANGVAIRQGYGFTWNSGTSTATLDNAPATGTDVFGYSPVTTTGRDPAVLTVADATSITPITDSYRIIHQTNTQSAGTLTINADSSTPVDGRAFTLRIDSTNIQTFSWNSQYVGGTIALPTATSGSGKVDYYSFIYYATDSKYHFIGSALNLG